LCPPALASNPLSTVSGDSPCCARAELIAATTASAIDVGALLTVVVGGDGGGDGVVVVVAAGVGAGVERGARRTLGRAGEGVVTFATRVPVGVVDLVDRETRAGESVGGAERGRGWLCASGSCVLALEGGDEPTTGRPTLIVGAACGVVGCAAAAITAATARTAPAARATQP
jgi:hypothetical protein